MNYQVTENNIHIVDSYTVRKREIRGHIQVIRNFYPHCNVCQRSAFSLRMEWYAHNLLYKMGIAPDRTRDVDLNCPQKWWEFLLYPLAGLLAYPFID